MFRLIIYSNKKNIFMSYLYNTIFQRRLKDNRIKTLHEIRPYTSAGTYYWRVPAEVTSVDVFLVGGGGAGGSCNSIIPYGAGGGGGGYTNTFKNIPVVGGELIEVIIGAGGSPRSATSWGGDGNPTQFRNSSYRVQGGQGGQGSDLTSIHGDGGNGGSGGGGGYMGTSSSSSYGGNGGSNGSNGNDRYGYNGSGGRGGTGQGRTTRDWGEATGKINAGGGGARDKNGGASDYTQCSGGAGGGGGYGGGGNAAWSGGAGGDGTCIIRYMGY
jgi:hypothetical protein